MTIKISQMTPKAGALSGNELLEITDGSATRRVTAQQLADLLRTPTTREIDLVPTGNEENDRKILLSDNHNVVKFIGNCGSPSIYIHDDVMSQDNFRFTIVVPESADNTGSGDGYTFYIMYYDGASSQYIWRLPSKEVQQTRDIAYDILISEGEIIAVGQTNSDVLAV